MAGLGEALILKPVTERIQAEAGLKGNFWIQDDGTLIGRQEALAKAIHIIESDGPERGAHINRSKSGLHCPKHDPNDPFPLGQGFPRSNNQGFKLLGAPIGTPRFVVEFLQKKTTKLTQSLGLLKELKCTPTASVLLRSCHSLPKVSYLM